MADPTGMQNMRKKDPYRKRTSRAEKASKVSGGSFWGRMMDPTGLKYLSVGGRRARKIRRLAKRMALEKEAEKLAEEILRERRVLRKEEWKLAEREGGMDEKGPEERSPNLKGWLRRSMYLLTPEGRRERRIERKVRKKMEKLKIESEARKRLKAEAEESESHADSTLKDKK